MTTLKGNLKAFNITNILQMISVEKKTGTFTVTADKNTVAINFSNGLVVWATKNFEADEERLKNNLIKNNYIKEVDWNKAAQEKQKSLKPLYMSLKKYVRADILSSAISRQTKDAVFNLLRWKVGNYEFFAQKIEYEKSLINPFEVEFLLMEGCRIADEWVELENSLSKIKKYITKNIIFPPSTSLNEPTKPVKDLEIELLKKRGIQLSEAEKNIFSLTDEEVTINDILNKSMLGEFEVYSILAKLLNLNIIKPVKKRKARKTSSQATRKGYGFYQFFDKAFGLFLLTLLIIINIKGLYSSYNRFENSITLQNEGLILLTKNINQLNWDLIKNHLDEYYLLKGHYPSSLDELIGMGLIEKKIITPWTRKKYDFLITTELFQEE